jgi:dipeptide/tripeptide permease
MNDLSKSRTGIRSFPSLFWLVVMFEFFERGAYYGMMSFLSDYFVSTLHFPKENVGVIKGVIQPLLYFLPVISGALADRFGYRRLLMIAFSLLGGGYFLTSQATQYGAVFSALVIMGFGAGLFKPLISGIIAKVTDEQNSTLGFGIYYWSINVGAFLFPLILVPFLKNINPTWVIIASAICTAAMLIPTALFFRDPARAENAKKRQETNMIQTLANAFEIIYSPLVLIYHKMKKSPVWRTAVILILGALLAFSITQYTAQKPVEDKFPKLGISRGEQILLLRVDRNMLGEKEYSVQAEPESEKIGITIFKPDYFTAFSDSLLSRLNGLLLPAAEPVGPEELKEWMDKSIRKITLTFLVEKGAEKETGYSIEPVSELEYRVTLHDFEGYSGYSENLVKALQQKPYLAGITADDCDRLAQETRGRSFFFLFLIGVVVIGLIITAYSGRNREKTEPAKRGIPLPFLLAVAVGAGLWVLPGLSLLGRIISSVIYLTVTSLFIIDKSSPDKFKDHAKFLLMIFLYSGFWVLYFQMFDSVLWYVRAYVDASSLNNTINHFLGFFGIRINWFFDVEHVTVINAGTIIILQLLISMIVRKRKALPTMMAGITLGTLGMAILAVNTSIWVFMAGIMIFSIGEMTAHPKFVSYVGLIAPPERKGMYMGYLFLYGVFGSSIGSIVGAKLYVHFVDYLNQPRTLWLIFSGIGVSTLIALSLFNRFAKPHGTGAK